jgi:hypothetical protein
MDGFKRARQDVGIALVEVTKAAGKAQAGDFCVMPTPRAGWFRSRGGTGA